MIATRIDVISRQVAGRETVALMVDPDATFQETNVSPDVPGGLTGSSFPGECRGQRGSHRVTDNTYVIPASTPPLLLCYYMYITCSRYSISGGYITKIHFAGKELSY